MHGAHDAQRLLTTQLQKKCSRGDAMEGASTQMGLGVQHLCLNPDAVVLCLQAVPLT